MNLKLIREKPDGNAKNAAVRGKLYQENGEFICQTLENLDYVIPAGKYTLAVTYSPKFKRPLPLICNVPKTSTQQTQHRQLPNIGNCRQGAMWAPLQASVADDCVKYRSGIRIHPGSKPEHSRGCILVSRADEEKLKKLILSERETRLEIN